MFLRMNSSAGKLTTRQFTPQELTVAAVGFLKGVDCKGVDVRGNEPPAEPAFGGLTCEGVDLWMTFVEVLSSGSKVKDDEIIWLISSKNPGWEDSVAHGPGFGRALAGEKHH